MLNLTLCMCHDPSIWKRSIKQSRRNDKVLIPDGSKFDGMPDEILLGILECLEDGYLRPLKYQLLVPAEKWSLPRAARVCRRWNALAEPLIYRRIRIVFRGPTRRQSNKEHRVLYTLLQHPQLCRHVREAELELCGEHEERYIADALKLLQHLRGSVKSLKMTGASSNKRILEQIASLRVVKMIMSDFYADFSLRELPWFGDCEKLNILHLHFHRFATPRQDLKPWTPIPPFKLPFPEDRQYCGSITSIVLGLTGEVHADELCSIMRWPAKLKHLKMNWILHGTNTETYNTSSIQKLLDYQNHSLESIELPMYGSFNGGSDTIPKLTTFSNLRLLTISDYNLFQTDPSTASRKLCAPALERIIIDTDNGDQQGQGIGKFDSESADWIHEFSRYRQGYFNESKLKDIHVILQWDNEILWYDNTGWPHKDLVSTKPLLEGLGIDLTWNRPFCTEKEFDELVKAFKDVKSSYWQPEADFNAATKEPSDRSTDGLSDDSEIDMILPKELEQGQRCICRWYRGTGPPCVDSYI